MCSHNCILAKVKLLLAVAICGALATAAQPLTVYSDLAVIDQATGNVTAPAHPREILSPAMVRNGFTSFQAVVQAPAEAQWRLMVSQNPEDSVKVTIYRESGASIEQVKLPYDGSGTAVFWMDLWTARDAPVDRVKVEPEVYIDKDWAVYPIEARVMEAVAPGMPQGTPLFVPLGGDCGMAFANPAAAEALSVRRLESRNLEQDMRLAQARSVLDEVRRRSNACNLVLPEDPERYLQIRDYLYSLR
jgi:hypothetical protein